MRHTHTMLFSGWQAKYIASNCKKKMLSSTERKHAEQVHSNSVLPFSLPPFGSAKTTCPKTLLHVKGQQHFRGNLRGKHHGTCLPNTTKGLNVESVLSSSQVKVKFNVNISVSVTYQYQIPNTLKIFEPTKTKKHKRRNAIQQQLDCNNYCSSR